MYSGGDMSSTRLTGALLLVARDVVGAEAPESFARGAWLLFIGTFMPLGSGTDGGVEGAC